MVSGHSQGGYQALAGAALDSRVSAFAAGVPAGCDHTGFKVGRPNGWPGLTRGAESDDLERIVETARYVDGVNLAGRTRAEGYFSVGFLDTGCNPVGVYAAYNNHPGQKRMINCPHMGHDAPRVWTVSLLAGSWNTPEICTGCRASRSETHHPLRWRH